MSFGLRLRVGVGMEVRALAWRSEPLVACGRLDLQRVALGACGGDGGGEGGGRRDLMHT